MGGGGVGGGEGAGEELQAGSARALNEAVVARSVGDLLSQV